MSVIKLWNQFWFESDGRSQVRLFRVGFGLLLLCCYLIRTLDLELFFGEHGLAALGILPDLVAPDFRFSIFHYWSSNTALWVGNSVFLASLLSFALGYAPRVSVITALVLHLSFLHRNPAVSYGVDTISCFFLFFLCFADYRDDRAYRPRDLRATLGSMAYRLCQLQVCIIYGYSGLKKLKGGSWWSGDAIWNTLADPQLARFDFSWMAHFPVLLAGATFLTLAWEIYFPALIWFKPIRVPLLVVGIFLHLGIAVGINLPFFATLMILTYVFFLERSVTDRVMMELGKIQSKLSLFTKVPRATSD